VEILNPAGADEWDIMEVKSTTEVKEEHFYDIAFQRLCCQFSGLKVRDCYLMHLNKDYIKSGEIDSAGLFVTENLTDKLAEYTCDLEQLLESIVIRLIPARLRMTAGWIYRNIISLLFITATKSVRNFSRWAF
jgi:hypothetical protein